MNNDADDTIDIQYVEDKEKLLHRLWGNSKKKEVVVDKQKKKKNYRLFFNYQQAQDAIESGYIEEFCGKYICCDLSRDDNLVDAKKYDALNGEGDFLRVVESFDTQNFAHINVKALAKYPRKEHTNTSNTTIINNDTIITLWPKSLSVDAITRLEKFRNVLEKRSSDHLGYPYNFDHCQHLGPLHDLLRFSLNNLGDPFDPSNYDVESRQFEQEVIQTYAKFWRIPQKEAYWGCVSHSGTEGNRMCLEIASRVHPNGILYFSDSAHYSIPGAASSFKLTPHTIKSQPTGEIYYEQLLTALTKGKRDKRPAIISLNIGTTMTGAIDSVTRVLDILKKLNYTDDEFYIHCDGALTGLMFPFMDIPANQRPDFQRPIASISCSGHKFLGCPMPAGIVVVRGKYTENVHEHIPYLNSKVMPSMGSRNGHSPVFLWFELQRKGIQGLTDDVQCCLDNATYLCQLLMQRKISVFKNPFSNTVVFERPRSMVFIKKYHLACNATIGHVVVMPSVQRDKLLEFADAFRDLFADDDDDVVDDDTIQSRPCVTKTCGQTSSCFCGLCNKEWNTFKKCM